MLTCPKTFRCSFAMCWLSIRFSFDDEHLQTYNEWTIHQYCHQLIAEKKTNKKLKKTIMTGKSPFRPLIARQDISSWDIEIQINRRNPYQISHQNPYVNHDPQFFGSPRSIGTGDLCSFGINRQQAEWKEIIDIVGLPPNFLQAVFSSPNFLQTF